MACSTICSAPDLTVTSTASGTVFRPVDLGDLAGRPRGALSLPGRQYDFRPADASASPICAPEALRRLR